MIPIKIIILNFDTGLILSIHFINKRNVIETPTNICVLTINLIGVSYKHSICILKRLHIIRFQPRTSTSGICGSLTDLFRTLVNAGCPVGVQSRGQGHTDHSTLHTDHAPTHRPVTRNSINIT